MDLCLKCNIMYKVQECCGEHPETGISVILTLENDLKVNACPNLTKYGVCKAYDEMGEGNGPYKCKDYDCPRLNEMDLVTRRELTERLWNSRW